MNKKRIVIPTLAIIGLISLGVATLHLHQSQQQRDNAEINADPSSRPNEDIYKIESSADLLTNIENAHDMANNSTYVALVRIDSIDGADNYSEATQNYVHPYTYGHLTIIDSYKGNLEIGASKVFYRIGGTIPVEKYRIGLGEMERQKFDLAQKDLDSLNKAKYIESVYTDDITIEQGKTYLAYMTDETAYYAKAGELAIIGFQGGLREVNNDMVLNNFTGQWELLSDVVD